VVKGRQHVDHHTVIDHRKPRGTSRELYKGVLDDTSSGVFNGRIIVRPGAQKTNAQQTNKNLLLSEEALVNTNPQLEIEADDVKCAHGATIGQLDKDALFYLRSRGIGREEARSILTRGFMADLSDRIRIAAVRDAMRRFVFAEAA
jgi:Fe-S cluster assembly protein SufD